MDMNFVDALHLPVPQSPNLQDDETQNTYLMESLTP